MLITLLRRARDATWFTDLGIAFEFCQWSWNACKLTDYFPIVKSFLMSDSFVVSTSPVLVKRRFCVVDIFVRMWRLPACFLLIFPVPVRVNLFLAPEWVFILGIVFCFICYFDFVDLGAMKINIRLPSSFGMLSTLPKSSNSCAKVSNKSSPRSLNTIALPLKCT